MLNKVVIDGLCHHFGERIHLEFFINVFDMRSYCFSADVQFIASHFVVVSPGYDLEHLFFPGRE